MMVLLQLFWEFFKAGLFAIGGGLATLPFLYDIADRTGWYTAQQLTDMVAVSESTPGPIGINTATYVGFTVSGVIGSVVATIGLITPSIIIILIIAKFLTDFGENKLVKGAFYGLRPASTALIAASGIAVARGVFLGDMLSFATFFDWRAVILAAVLLVLTRWTPKVKSLHPIVFIGFSAIVGIVFSFAS